MKNEKKVDKKKSTKKEQPIKIKAVFDSTKVEKKGAHGIGCKN